MAAEITSIAKMLAKDAISSKMASAYITVDGNRYLLFQAKNLDAKLTKEKSDVPILGKMEKGHKTTGLNGTGSMTIYKNTPLFDDMMLKLAETGEDTYFDMQVTNEDPTSDAGRQTVILKGCNIDEVSIASFDADGEWLEQDIDFTFESVERPEKFNMLTGMQ